MHWLKLIWMKYEGLPTFVVMVGSSMIESKRLALMLSAKSISPCFRASIIASSFWKTRKMNSSIFGAPPQ